MLLESPSALLSYRETTPQHSAHRGAGLPVKRTRKIRMQVSLLDPCIHMLVNLNVLMWFRCFFYLVIFATMLSLDFLDDVRRMNKRQVGTQASLLWCYDRFFVWKETPELTWTSRRPIFNGAVSHLLASCKVNSFMHICLSKASLYSAAQTTHGNLV